MVKAKIYILALKKVMLIFLIAEAYFAENYSEYSGGKFRKNVMP